MANYPLQNTSYANNATIRTGLSRCDQIVNLTQTIQNLYDLYQNNLSNPVSNLFSSLSIINFNCTSSSEKYFEHVITFINAVSIRVQIAFASIYYDYIDANQYSFNGFYIEPERRFNLSSVTLNYTGQSDACSSANIAQDPLCPLNSSTPICVTLFSNPWIYNCSENVSTSTIPPLTTTASQLSSAGPLGVLSLWQIGVICGLGILFLLLTLLAIGCFIRRRSLSTSIIPQIPVTQQTPIIIQPKQTKNTPVTRFYTGSGPNMNRGHIINRKPPKPSNPGVFTDHPKQSHPAAVPPKIPPKATKPVFISYNHINAVPPKVNQTLRPVSGTSTKQLRTITDGLEANTLDESGDIPLDRSNPIKPDTPMTSVSTDESLHDEDAWMPILAVANAELDVLNRLESEQNHQKTLV